MEGDTGSLSLTRSVLPWGLTCEFLSEPYCEDPVTKIKMHITLWTVHCVQRELKGNHLGCG